MTDIVLDGNYIGTTNKPRALVRKIREARRSGKLNYQVNVVYDSPLDEVRIYTTEGRVRRPLIVVENGKPRLGKEHLERLRKGELKWSDLVKEGIIEYLDAEEEENAYVALTPEDLTPKHTHLELSPAVIFGFSTSFLPFLEFNRGDRVTYSAKMIGQAIGNFLLSRQCRVDTKSNLMVYPQIPLVRTHLGRIREHERHPAGMNIIIAVLSWDGYNMEDAIVVNAGSVERGLFRSYMYRTYEAEERRYMGGQQDEIKIPEAGVRGYAGVDAYTHLPEDGIINPETSVKAHQVLIGRVSPLRFLGPVDQFITGIENIRETSITLRHGDKGIVDNVLITQTEDGTKLVKVVVRDPKIPEVGDKFTTRHGQKGVMGLLVPPEDMPFTESGIIPDIIFDPHGIPSRMTIGQLLEIIAGKVSMLRGEHVKAAPFDPTSEEELRKALESLGFRNDGKETMYDGRTGRKYEVQIFIGSCYYEKLDHLVSNKIHARSRGPVTLLTKQPTEGRSKEGGLRLGEMEKDCLLGHGSVLTLKERFDVDKTLIPVCTECGMIAIHDLAKNEKYCRICKKSVVQDVEMGYAFKLLLEEFKSMLIYPKLRVKDGKIEEIEFGVLGPEIVKRMAVAKITKPELYDEEGYPIEGGLMDPRLGVVDPGIRCRTCGGRIGSCQGHFGYVELTKPVLHVLYIKWIGYFLKAFCRKCGRVLLPEDVVSKYKGKKVSIAAIARIAKDKCPYCGTQRSKLRFIKPHTFVEGKEMLTPLEIRERFERIPDEDLRAFDIRFRPEWLVVTMLPIPSVTVRPSITLETGERSEDDLTHKLMEIVRINDRLKENLELGAPEFIIMDLWELLQYHVSTYFKNELSGVPPARHRSGRILKTLAQRLATKEGRFRGNLAGKRVNFSARTVISPDSWIGIDEVGVPEEIARELTIPVRVNEQNIELLRMLILNGPDVWPGASSVVRPDGRRKKVTELNKAELAQEIMPGYVVERHLFDGDVVIFNRQPSLHRMSMLAHRVRVMPGKTFRIHLCVCPGYNADFDGDEMNLHAPQTAEARVEAQALMSVTKHLRSPRFSGPIVGGTTDYITGLYLLTSSETKLPRQAFVQMIRAVDSEVQIPDRSWMSGKEVFSLFLPSDLSMSFRATSCKGCEKCAKERCPHDAFVVIKGGKLIHGVIDKASIGAMKGLILSHIEKRYGAQAMKEFLSNVTRLSLCYLALKGFSISIADQDLPAPAQRRIREEIEAGIRDVHKLVKAFREGKLKGLPGRGLRESLDILAMRRASRILERVERILVASMRMNPTLAISTAGAKGSIINIVQTAALVGQETVMGKRISRGYYNKVFSHFTPDDLSLSARGFVARGFKQGLKPHELFFDMINSRESLMDKSLKTRHSGYMERRLVASLHDLVVSYDGTVRDSAGRIVQFEAGEDGIDPSKVERIGIDVERIAQAI